MKYPKPKVGDMVYIPKKGHRIATTVEVTKVGRKYFYLGYSCNPTKVKIDSWDEATDYGTPRTVYPSEEEYQADVALEGKYDRVRKYFNRSYARPFHLDQEKLDKILEIIGEENGD